MSYLDFGGCWQDLWPAGVKVIADEEMPVIPIETLRSQCEIVAIDGDSEGPTHPDDDLLLGYAAAAVEYAEDFTGLAIAPKTVEMALDSFPGSWHRYSAGIELVRGPVVEIISFRFSDESEGELDQGDHYTLDDFRNPPRVLPVTSWPSMTPSSNRIRIQYRVGFSNEVVADSDAPKLPKAIRQAILLLTAHFYKHREDTVEGALTSIPNGAKVLLNLKRIRTGMA